MEEIIKTREDVVRIVKKYEDKHLPDLVITASNIYGFFRNKSTIKSIKSITFHNTKPITCLYAFAGCSSLKAIPIFDTSEVTNMSGMFSYCSSLTDIPEFNVNPLIPMDNIITGCVNLKKIPQFILINQLAK